MICVSEIDNQYSAPGALLLAQMVKNLPAMQEMRVWSLGWEDPLEKGMAYPLQYSSLENFMDRRAWWATVHGDANSWTRLSSWHFQTHIMCLLSQAFSSVQSLSRVQLFATPWTAACQASLSITNSWSLVKLMFTKSVMMFIESVMPTNHLILCRPLLLLPSISPSIRVFSNESVLHIRWPKYWSFSFSISPSNEYLGLISFRIDWLDLLAFQGILKSLLQHHSSKSSILRL